MFKGNELAIAICQQLKSQRLAMVYDTSGKGPRWRMPLPQAQNYLPGVAAKQIRVELPAWVTGKYK